jgi:universal stress protein A
MSAIDPITVGYRRILCPVDFSECSRKAFYTAVAYARHFQAELDILHVSERTLSGAGYEEVEAEASLVVRLETGLKRRLDELQADGFVTDEDRERMILEIGGGKPYVEILRYAEERQVDLIVMGTHGHAGLRHVLIGSQAERVVRRAACHVLTVKPDGFSPEAS